MKHKKFNNRRRILKYGGSLGSLALASPFFPGLARAKNLAGQEMVFASWGGAYQEAQKTAYCDSFSEATGATVIQDGPSSGAKLRTMVEQGAPIWDAVDVTDIFLYANADKGLFEPIDTNIVDTSLIDPQFVHSHGIGCIVWSYNIGFNTDILASHQRPKNWADVFNLKKIPGKRTLRDRVYPTLEQALLADGVSPQALYPLDVNRAFAKLDTIKDEVIWWTSNSQSQQLFTDGVVSCGMILNGRAFDVVKKGGLMDIEWNQNIQSVDYIAIPRGAKNKRVAMHFLNEMMQADNQAEMANIIAYAPVNNAAFSDIDASVSPWLSTEKSNAAKGFVINAEYWRQNLDALTERWNEWKLS